MFWFWNCSEASTDNFSATKSKKFCGPYQQFQQQLSEQQQQFSTLCGTVWFWARTAGRAQVFCELLINLNLQSFNEFFDSFTGKWHHSFNHPNRWQLVRRHGERSHWLLPSKLRPSQNTFVKQNFNLLHTWNGNLLS